MTVSIFQLVTRLAIFSTLLTLGSVAYAGADTDGDGVDDAVDNCILVFNPGQQDTDNDSFGNACDGDFDQNGIVNLADLAQMRLGFFGGDPDLDMNSDSIVNFLDLQLFKAGFFLPPGPSANPAPTDIQLDNTSVDENQPSGTAVGTFTSTDLPAGDTHTYTLAAGAGDTDNAQFAIVGDQLETAAVLNYEATDNCLTSATTCSIRVQTDDGNGGTYQESFIININDVNEAPVITSDGGGATAAVSAAENQTAVTDIDSTDPDGDVEGAGLTYSITGGADQALFSIGASGVLMFSSAPNFENPTDAGGDNVYDVQVTVTDSGAPNLTDVQDIAVTVTDVNDAPVITSDGGGATAAVSAAENQTAVTTVTATDEDLPPQTLTYSITGGADAALFSIGAASGVLTFNTAPDFDNPTDAGGNNVYDVQVTVTDNGAPNLTDVQDIAVTVTDVNDAPVITSDGGGATAAVSTAENQTAVTTVTATDEDLPAQTLTFSITGGADAALFSIGGASGVLTFNAAPDFENPTDAGGNNVYDVQVTVTDNGAPNLTDVQDIAVTVTDVNDAPVITSDGGGATAAVNAAENQTTASTVTATDEDVPAQTLSYSITGGADAALFGIGGASGVLTFNAAPDFENPTDAGGNNVYDVQVTVTDNGAPNLTDVQDIAVTVTDVNEAPVITSDGGGATAAVSAPENQTTASTVTATDEDVPAQTLTYSITGGADAALFSIGGASGVLTFNAAPDFENPTDAGGNNVYDVQVTVTDNGAPNLADVQDIAVTATDVNDAPVITSDGGGATASVSVPEAQTAVTTVTTTDEDLPAQALSYAITGGADAALFGINPATGVLIFNPAPDFENPTDAGGNNIYDVQVTVTDNGAPNLTDVQDIAVTVTDVPEPTVTIDMPAAGSSIVNFVLVDFTGTNPAGNSLVYDFSYSTDSGSTFLPATDFGGGSVFGNPTVIPMPPGSEDWEWDTSADIRTDEFGVIFQVGVTDSVTGESGSSQIMWDVPNQATCTIDLPVSGSTLTGNTLLSITTVQPSPNGLDLLFEYSVDGGTSFLPATDAGGGTVAGNPGVGTSPGSDTWNWAATTDVTADTNGVIFRLTISDSVFGPPGNSTCMATYDIDVNDAPTDIALDNSSVDENEPAGTAVGNLTTTDQDTADTHTYTLVAGAGDTDNAQFMIVGAQLQTAAILDFETAANCTTSVTTCSIRVQTDDGNGGVFNKSFIININDVLETNTAPVANTDNYTTGIGNTRFQLVAALTGTSFPATVQFVGTVIANDTDADAGDTLSATANPSIATTQGGTASIDTAGRFIYTPAATFPSATVDSFTYEVCDDGTPMECVNGTVNITGSGIVWYVDDSSPSNPGTGTAADPFRDLASASPGPTMPGQTIFVYAGTQFTGISLQNNQSLLGEGVALVVGPTTLSNAGTRPEISVAGTAITLGMSNTVRGIDISGSSTGILGTAFGTLTANTVAISTNGGPGINLSSGAGSATFDSLSSSLSSGSGIDLNSVSGSFSFGGGSISASGGDDAVEITNSTATISYAGSITAGTGLAVDISSQSAGSVSLSGLISSSGQGISLVSNTGSTINLSGGMSLSTGSSTAFSATNGGTLNVTGSNAVTTTTATAVNISGITIGGSGLTFQSVTSTGSSANAAISLTSTGAGTFTVNGGTIDNKTDDAIRLNNTGGRVSLNNMIIEDIGSTAGGNDTRSGHDAIHGQVVSGGLTLSGTTIRRVSDNCIMGTVFSDGLSATTWNGLDIIANTVIEDCNRHHVAGVGDSQDEGAVRIQGLTGTVTIDNSTFRRAGSLFDLSTATSGTLTMDVTSSDFFDAYKALGGGAFGEDCINLLVEGSSTANLTIGGSALVGNSFDNCGSASINVAKGITGSATVTVIVDNNNFTVSDHTHAVFGNQPQGGVALRAGPGGITTFDARVSFNTFGVAVGPDDDIGSTTDEVGNANGLAGNVGLIFESGVSQARVNNNTFNGSLNAPWFNRASGNTSAAVLYKDNNYRGRGDWCCDGGFMFRVPGVPTRTTSQNDGSLDLTIVNDDLPAHDQDFFADTETIEFLTRNDATSGGGTLCLALSGTTSPDGYEFKENSGTFEMYQGAVNNAAAGPCTSAHPSGCEAELGDDSNRGGPSNHIGDGAGEGVPTATLNPPHVDVDSGSIDITGTACTMPSGGIF